MNFTNILLTHTYDKMYIFKPVILSAVVLLLTGFTAYGQEHQHEEHLSALLKHYLNLKDALAVDNFEDARISLAEFRKEVVEREEMNNHEEHAQVHAKHHGAMVEAVEKAAGAEDIEELRSAFADISDNLIIALEKQGYDEITLHIQYCPMADGNTGAWWISDHEKIINPYMGRRMQSCGTTKKTNEKNQ